MRNGWRVVFAAIVVVGLAGLALVANIDRRELAFTLGVVPTQVAGVVASGDTACQGPIDVPADAERVRFQVGTYRRPGPPLRVEVRDLAGGAGAATASVPGGYPDGAPLEASAPVREGGRVAVCVRNEGSRRVALYGGSGMAARTSELRVDGRRTGTDLTLIFEREEARSVASLLPEMVERATLFKPRWLSAGLIWALAAAFLAGVPALLALAISRAADRSSLGE